MLETKKINDEKVEPVEIKKINPKEILGYNLFSEPYSNIFCCARKKSGKSTTIFHILKKSVNKDTNVVVFCSTYTKDPTWIEIQKYLEEKDIPNEFHTSIFDDSKKNILDELIEYMTIEESDSESSEEEEIQLVNFNSRKKYKKKKKKTKLVPKYFIIFDDLSTELRNKTIPKLLKKNRHYKCKILLSSQYLNDMDPQSIRQLDYTLVFKGLPQNKLEELYSKLDLNIGYDLFLKLYHDATKENYNFLYIGNDGTYRKNFNNEYQIDKLLE